MLRNTSTLMLFVQILEAQFSVIYHVAYPLPPLHLHAHDGDYSCFLTKHLPKWNLRRLTSVHEWLFSRILPSNSRPQVAVFSSYAGV